MKDEELLLTRKFGFRLTIMTLRHHESDDPVGGMKVRYLHSIREGMGGVSGPPQLEIIQ
jgi:hypothetical protein